jgi:hypothetical protein
MMKKKLYLVAASCLLFSFKTNAQVGIGTTVVENDLLLKVSSTNKGILIPNLTIPNLNASAPVTNPALGLLAYNKATGKQGFNFWDGTKWNELVDTRNIYSVLGLTISYSVSNSSPVDINAVRGAINYPQESLPGTTWTEVPGLSKDITITQANNSISVITEGMIQANNSAASAGSDAFTYAVGIFIDGKLSGVRNYSTKYSNTYQYDFFSINSVFNNLSLGNHTIKTYVTVRASNLTGVTLWRYGGPINYSPPTNPPSSINSDMSRINMFIKLTEKS